MKLTNIKKTSIPTAIPVSDDSSGKSPVAPARIEPEGLDPYYGNPEFSSAADNLINVINDYIVRVKARPYNGKEVLEIANKILESRIR